MNHKTVLDLKARALELAADTPRRGMTWPVSGCTEAHLEAINAMPQVLTPLTAEDVFVRGIYALNDQPMFGNLMVETAGVLAVARMAKGVPVLANHDTGWAVGAAALPFGRVFAGEPEVDAQGVTWAKLLAWFPATDENAELVQRMDAGAIGENSVSIGYETTECSICGAELWDCPHIPGEAYNARVCMGIVRGVKELFETSLVWAGRAKGTRFFLAADLHSAAVDLERLAVAKRERQWVEGLLEQPVELEALLSHPAPVEDLLR